MSQTFPREAIIGLRVLPLPAECIVEVRILVGTADEALNLCAYLDAQVKAGGIRLDVRPVKEVVRLTTGGR